jgi:PIN domain nuclease of toxin-antitoxin system
MILLDSNALFWWMSDPSILRPEARAAAAGERGLVHVSVASIWELEIKRVAGRLALPSSAWDSFAEEGFALLDLTMADVIEAARLHRHHDDPFDRVIIAQAQRRSLTIVSRDRSFLAYGVSLITA